jgi:hypothetical protein
MVSPRDHEKIGMNSPLANNFVIVGSNRFLHGLQDQRLSGPVGEKVDDLYAAIVPGLRESDATTNRRIIVTLIGSVWIEHYK